MKAHVRNQAEAPDYFRPKVAARFLGLGESTLAKWRLKGRPFGEGPPFLKVGKAVIYRRDELDRWLAEQAATDD